MLVSQTEKKKNSSSVFGPKSTEENQETLTLQDFTEHQRLLMCDMHEDNVILIQRHESKYHLDASYNG